MLSVRTATPRRNERRHPRNGARASGDPLRRGSPAADRACPQVYAGRRYLQAGGPVETAIFDADSHLMETPEWLGQYRRRGGAGPARPPRARRGGSGAAELMASLPELWESHRHQEIGPEVLKGPKGWMAPGGARHRGALPGARRAAHRRPAGVPDLRLGHFSRSKDPDVLYGGTEALNRAMVAFCGPIPRLKAVGYLPLNDPAPRAGGAGGGAREGVAAVWVPSDAPGDFSPTHLDLDPVWARLAEAGRALRPPRRGAASCCPRPSTTTGARGPRTGWAAARTCAPRTSRCCTTRPSASSPAWRSTASSSATRPCAGRPSSSARPGCRACCATSTTPCAPSPSSSRRCRS